MVDETTATVVVRWKLVTVPSWNSSGLLPAFLTIERPEIVWAEALIAPAKTNPMTETHRVTVVLRMTAILPGGVRIIYALWFVKKKFPFGHLFLPFWSPD